MSLYDPNALPPLNANYQWGKLTIPTTYMPVQKPLGQIGEAFKAKKAGKNGAHVVLLIDESGSMGRLRDTTVSSANEFIASQREDAKTNNIKTFISVYTFDGNHVKAIRDNVNVEEVREITNEDYNPIGMTNLYDGMGSVIATVNQKLASAKKKERPSVIITIITDGLENASKTFSMADIQKMYSKCNESNWAFMFMGANIDAFSVGSQLGFNVNNTIQYAHDSAGVTATSMAATRMVNSLKAEMVSGSSASLTEAYAKTAFTDEERASAMGSKKDE